MIMLQRSQASKDAEAGKALAAIRDSITAERDRRFNAGITFQGNRFQTRPQDIENITGSSIKALKAIVKGAQEGDLRWHGGTNPFVWIAEDNSLVPMDAHTLYAFGEAIMEYKEKLIFRAYSLKQANPIPSDITLDVYWPDDVF